MKEISCKNCGGDQFKIKKIYRICQYCGSKYLLTAEERAMTSKIELGNDVKRLLAKCKSDPKHARRYANLVLDIDPTNLEARRYLKF